MAYEEILIPGEEAEATEPTAPAETYLDHFTIPFAKRMDRVLVEVRRQRTLREQAQEE